MDGSECVPFKAQRVALNWNFCPLIGTGSPLSHH